jgi:hypothetical protein
MDLEVEEVDAEGILYPEHQTFVFYGERIKFGKRRAEPKSFMLSDKAIGQVVRTRGKGTDWIQEGVLIQEDCAEENLSEDDDNGDYVLPNNVLVESLFIPYWPTLCCYNRNPVMQVSSWQYIGSSRLLRLRCCAHFYNTSNRAIGPKLRARLGYPSATAQGV